MVFHATLRRLLGKRRLFVACITVITVSITYLCYQALSIHKLGEELSAEYIRRKDFHNSFQSYQKADFPVHLFNDADKDSDKESKNPAGEKDHGIRIRGVLVENVKRYIPNSRGNFKCLHSSEEVSYHRVNDNYCDCQDGSDEPSTSACHNGRFYCEHQPAANTAKKNVVLSSRVNDGICDCCDGSDEWGNAMVPEHSRIDEFYEKKTGYDQTPCHDRCSKTGFK